MAKKPSLIELKKQLRKKTHYELVEEVAFLYKKFKPVKEYYQTSFFDDDSGVLEKYKEIVRNEYIPNGRSRFPKMRAKVARKAVSDYKKVSTSNKGIADIMLTYVESGVHCTNEFGDLYESFYNSMESMYESALKFMVKEGLFFDFEDRAAMIVQKSSNTGWGFYDQLSWLFEEYKGQAEASK